MNDITMQQRFRGYLPVVIDIETSGFDPEQHAMLEIAGVPLTLDADYQLKPDACYSFHVKPFADAVLDPASLKFTGIDPAEPLRPSIDERDALQRLFRPIRQALRLQQCQRAILVGHNAFFDMQFLNAAVKRTGIKRNPFHPFSFFDTVTLAGVMVGQTVLAKAVQAAGLSWDNDSAHQAEYDAMRTAELFCLLSNQANALFLDNVQNKKTKN